MPKGLSKSWEESDAAERAITEGLRFAGEGYESASCNNPECGRHRVGLRKNGRLICEKCNWDQVAKTYDVEAGSQ